MPSYIIIIILRPPAQFKEGTDILQNMSDFASSSMDIVEDIDPRKDRSQLPWVEKYRPNSLSDLIAHEEIIQILNKLIESNKLPHLLFHGPPGMSTTILYF